MHLAVYEARPDVGAVVHTHAPMATIWGLFDEPVPVLTRRCDLDFFPAQSFLSMVELDRPAVVERGFYKQRELRVLERNQPRLLG
jgi:ribulose-5-phosphate 4-epimerase/fuculose-1-phosphate aldolase